MKTMNRRQALSLMGLAGAGFAMAGMPLPSLGKKGSITVTALGGDWERAVRDCFVAPYQQATGNDVKVLLGTPAQWLSQIEANREKPPIDALITTPDLAISASEGDLMDFFTVDKLPNLADIPQVFTDSVKGKGTVFDYGVAGFTYNKETIKTPPKSFRELIERTADGDWVLSLPSISYPATPAMLIWPMANALGGGIDDVDVFFAAMKKIQKNTMFWNSPNDFFNQLQSGEADIGVYFDGRTWTHYDAGATWIDFVNPEEGGSLSAVVIQKPRNASPLAWDYINVMLSQTAQLKFAEALNYGVTNSKVVYPEAIRNRITPWQDSKLAPYEQIASVRSEWVDRWNREISR